MQRKILFFFTATFPYGKGEAFIESEMPFLAAHFDKIIIVSNTHTGEKRNIPENVEIEYFPYELSFFEKIAALKNLNTLLFKEEKSIIKNRYTSDFSKITRNILLTSIYKAEKLRKFIGKLEKLYVKKEDSVYLYSYWMNDMAAGCAYIREKNQNYTFICRAHGWDVYFERHEPPYLPLRNYISTWADKIYFVSAHGLNYFSEKNKISENTNLNVSYLGSFNQTSPAAFSRDRNTFKIVSCSSVIPLKRLDLMAQAISKLIDTKIEWTHLGGGQGEITLEQQLKSIFKNNNKISWQITGAVTHQEVMSYYRTHQYDVFINTSSFEGLPVSIMEAFSFGIPAVAPDVGGIKEIVKDGLNGFLFDVNAKPDGIALLIKHLIDMPDERYLNMRANAYKEWNYNFNAAKNYRSFIESLAVNSEE